MNEMKKKMKNVFKMKNIPLFSPKKNIDAIFIQSKRKEKRFKKFFYSMIYGRQIWFAGSVFSPWSTCEQ